MFRRDISLLRSDFNFILGKVAHKQNNFEQAEKIYKKLLVENPNNYLVLGNLALLEIQLKHYPNAIDYLKKAIKVNANFWVIVLLSYKSSFI